MSANASAASTEPRSQAERRAGSWNMVVRAAIDIVAEEGVGAATFRAIAARAGYHRSLVTQRFGARRGLVEAIIKHLDTGFEQAIREHGIDELPGLDALLRDTDLYLADFARSPDLRAYFMMVSSAIADLSELRSAFAAGHERIRQRIVAIVVRGQSDGTIRPDVDADAAALMIGSLRLGLSIQALVEPTMDLASVRETVMATLRSRFGAAGPQQ